MAAINYDPSTIRHPDMIGNWQSLNNATVDGNARSFTAGTTPLGLTARSALIHTDPANTIDISIGPDTDCTTAVLGADSSFIIDAGGSTFSLQQWYFKAAAAGQAIHVAYIQ